MYGSKFDNLAALREHGVRIPAFTVIPFEDAVDDPSGITALLREGNNLPLAELSGQLKDYLAAHCRRKFDVGLYCGCYAVRSSSNIEDGSTDSFAGQFDTYLNVSPAELQEKILACFQSLFNENVLGYMRERGLDPDEMKMNVIVQEMVPSELSGILFTANPQGILNESVIVVGRGLGENVVSDKINTTAYYYHRTDKVYYYEGQEDLLSESLINTLIETAQNIESVLGKYLDIEFAIVGETVYILQARNITTLSDDHPLILDNSNIVESYPGVSLPLTISFVQLCYSGVFSGLSRRVLKDKKTTDAYSDVFYQMVGHANGRMYYKISNWYTMIKFLPFSSKIIPVWQEMLGVKNKTYDSSQVRLSPRVRAMTYFNSAYELIRTPKNMEKLEHTFEEIHSAFYRDFSPDIGEDELWKLYRRVERELLACWDITLLNDTYTFIFTGLLKARLKKKYKNYDEKANAYISGITNIESMRPIREMIALAYEADSLTDEEYQRRFRDYIQQYGDRNLEELKMESPTFRTNPELLEERLADYRRDKKRLKEMYDSLSGDSASEDPAEGRLTGFFCRKCRCGIRNREISRLNRSRIFGMVRSMFLRWGEIYASQGILNETRDIFYLTLEEIEELYKNKKDMTDTVNKRKEDAEMFRCLPAYTRLIFAEDAFDKHHTNVNKHNFYRETDSMRGIPCSNGIVRGEALVITDVHAAQDVTDKILVTKMTDPGWVFLLATAKGVISEKGSLLSHTAIISRELNIPSIVGVSGVLESVNSGDILEMDGTTGEIKILKKGGEMK